MANRVVISFVFLFLLGVVAPIGIVAEEKFYFSHTEFLKVINDGDYKEAANYFYYPSFYSPTEKQEEHLAISLTLEKMVEVFGSFSYMKEINKPIYFYHFSVGVGDISYWKSSPEFMQKIYAIKYSREGPGYIILRFPIDQKENSQRLMSLSFGIPQEASNSKKRIEEIIDQMFRFMENMSIGKENNPM